MLENQDQITSPHPVAPVKKRMAEKASFLTLLILAILAPIFIVPSSVFSVQAGKVFVIVLGVILAFSFFVAKALRVGRIKLPKGVIFSSALAILVFGLVSTLFSGAVKESFFGLGDESSTFLFTLVLFLTLFTSFKVLNSTRKVLSLYSALFISFILLLAYQLLRIIFGADFLSFGLFLTPTSSLLGRWNDLSTVSGLSVLMLLVSYKASLNLGLFRILKFLLFVLSAVFLIALNSLLAWGLLGFASLVLLAYTYLLRRIPLAEEKVKIVPEGISKFSLVLLIFSALFILIRGPVGNFMSTNFNLSRLEARPSFSSTLEIAKDTLSESPGFGTGANRFSIAWGKSKPLPVNNTVFWDVNFNYGLGFILTDLVTNGLLGFIAWLVFLGSLLLLGVRSLFMPIVLDKDSRFVLVSSFFGILYLWAFSIFSVPGTVTLFLTFLLTGIFLSASSRAGLVKERDISFSDSDDSKLGFVTVFVLIVVLILNAGLLYASAGRYLSLTYSQKALKAVNVEGNLEDGLRHMNKALALAKTDNNYRLMSQVHIGRLNRLLNNQELAGTKEGAAEFQQILGATISNAQAATREDEADYRNWLSLGNIYEAIIPLQIQGAYEGAKATYERAGLENPTNPSVDLSLARLEVLNGDNDKARVLINNSLQKKNNYTEAIFLLSQIEINEGNITDAVKAVEAASLINPNDPLTFFQLGFLKFNQNDYEGAIQALERAVILNSSYSNAKYFLGLAYYNVGRVEESIAQFSDVQTLNPENADIKQILENLRLGNSPLLNVNVPGEGEEVDSLPLQES
ncbi:hypothetical protein COV42_01645 [Candidatus Campbellbacteria bacterium CG11_big_fil_rev_8_21_14_0_20_44_21]|uniref:Uncharacterized protein n=1 Tax=Candidatus Campbellbacteria bacterium CG22_combo_CG10-13_8_21_14_all_43_18 TaxID=1974530 RepID=A0A2H0DXP8_9BACT|nr:MAG: hypothetical protein COW82_00240 [Candidatus Campbellbacteria bacterium CG22_combo_CG10-13_8_21_14_all_43_18]PIR24260.1 MAG: hypothetical protein COV42_01645 [Candidatus Campbellbacteria bacterium CG11_big_fil_rev_8_21_14_0_20_44_21]